MLIPTTVLTANLDGVVWNSYTPVWSSTGTQPAINNGVMVGEYMKIGQLAVVRISMIMGSSTTFGTGNYSLSYPTPVPEDGSVGLSKGDGIAFDSSGSVIFNMHWRSNSIWNNAAGAVTLTSPTSPFTWAQNDQLQLQVLYHTSG